MVALFVSVMFHQAYAYGQIQIPFQGIYANATCLPLLFASNVLRQCARQRYAINVLSKGYRCVASSPPHIVSILGMFPDRYQCAVKMLSICHQFVNSALLRRYQWINNILSACYLLHIFYALHSRAIFMPQLISTHNPYATIRICYRCAPSEVPARVQCAPRGSGATFQNFASAKFQKN